MPTLLPHPYMPQHYAFGQPTPEQLKDFSRAGVRTVINLRAPSEPVEYDEASQVRNDGMHYVALPIAGAADLDAERIRQFGHALDEARQHGAVLIHCASSNRAGALVALDEVFNRGASLENALQRGRLAGLAGLEPAVVAFVEQGHTTPST